MATKRRAADDLDGPRARTTSDHHNKRRKPDGTGKPFKIKRAHPVNELKSQIRSLTRLLERNDGLPATVRVEKERALQTAQHELDVAHRAHNRTEMISKYHKIRFFDRQKATRRLKKSKKELRAYDGDDEVRRKELGQAVDENETELNYAMYYPLEKAYVPLFPTRRKAKDDDDSEGAEKTEAVVQRQGDPAIWKTIKQCMADGTLESLREGRLNAEERSSKAREAHKKIEKPERAKNANKKKEEPKPVELPDGRNRRERRRAKPVEVVEDDDSEGGFFE